MFPIVVIAAHAFVALAELKERRHRLSEQCESWRLKGSVALTPEGIDFCVAGEATSIQSFLDEIRTWPGLAAVTPRLSGAARPPFQRMIVRLKQELAALGVEGIDPVQRACPQLSPSALLSWFHEGRDAILLDVRNASEVRLGTFRGARSFGIERFRDLPPAMPTVLADQHDKHIVVFCDSGVRSEKAGLFLEREGFRHVQTLSGGILGYIEHCGREHFEGDCRLLNEHLSAETGTHSRRWVQCSTCRTPLSETDRSHPHFDPEGHCPYCYRATPQALSQTIAERREQLERIVTPLPGSVPRDYFRPINIPGECNGWRLIDALLRVVPHLDVAYWRERCDLAAIVDERGVVMRLDQVVRAGQRLRHLFPAIVEPEVDMNVGVLFEDASIVVLNKPAPLPMHAGGRFVRNTLKYVLDELYAPQKLRPAHRLDANTTGVVVASRTQFIAGKIQSQFARGEVTKRYLARVQGHPQLDEFACDAPISVASADAGSRFVDEASGLAARTEFTVLRRLDDGTALLEARPLTGRTNQIRVHLWHLGLPICGDQTYLNGGEVGSSQTRALDAPPLCLHAWRIAFRHPVRKDLVSFEAPAPDWAEMSEAPARSETTMQ